MSQKSSVMQLPQFVPKALTSDTDHKAPWHRTNNGRAFRMLNVLDEFTRESLAIRVAWSGALGSVYVNICPGRGAPGEGRNRFLTEGVTEERAWDPDTMIWNARSLQKVARELTSGRVPPEEDAFLFTGQQLAEPILLALATEIALKAWQCREQQGPPDSSHDLLKLFEGLSHRARTILEAHCPEHPDPLGTHVFVPIQSGMRRILGSGPIKGIPKAGLA